MNVRHVMFFTHHKPMLDIPMPPHSTVNGMYYAQSRDRDVICPMPETIRTAGMWGNFSPQQCSTPLILQYGEPDAGVGLGSPDTSSSISQTHLQFGSANVINKVVTASLH
jgi:hypothetical protein